MSIDDGVALFGLLLFLSGIFLWLGLAATLITLGLVMVYIGYVVEIPQRVNNDEPDKTTNTTVL